MEKHTLVKELLSKGIMVSPQELESMKDGNIVPPLDRNVQKSTRESKVLCKLDTTLQPKKITIDDAVRENCQMYEKLKKVLLRKVEAVSINNIGRSSTKNCILGLVREITQNGFVLEDTTGNIHVKTTEKPEQGDVVAVRGWLRESVFFAEEVVYPDIPMAREVSTIDCLITLSDRSDHLQKSDISISPDTLMVDGDEKRLPNPAWISLERDGKSAVIVVYSCKGKIEKETALHWLKRRYVGPSNGPVPDNARVLEKVPDILWIVSENEQWTFNYKGVTVISFGRGKSALVDMKTRKVEIM